MKTAYLEPLLNSYLVQITMLNQTGQSQDDPGPGTFPEFPTGELSGDFTLYQSDCPNLPPIPFAFPGSINVMSHPDDPTNPTKARLIFFDFNPPASVTDVNGHFTGEYTHPDTVTYAANQRCLANEVLVEVDGQITQGTINMDFVLNIPYFTDNPDYVGAPPPTCNNPTFPPDMINCEMHYEFVGFPQEP